MDPTVDMLSRVIEATGHTLELSATAPTPPSEMARKQPRLGDLVAAWQRTESRDQPEWTALRAFLDHLALHPEQVASAIAGKPRRSGSPMMDTLLAGIAEKLADDTGRPRPAWTTRVPAMKETWLPPGTPRMRELARRTAPTQLAERGLLIGERSLWRRPGTLDA